MWRRASTSHLSPAEATDGLASWNSAEGSPTSLDRPGQEFDERVDFNRFEDAPEVGGRDSGIQVAVLSRQRLRFIVG